MCESEYKGLLPALNLQEMTVSIVERTTGEKQKTKQYKTRFCYLLKTFHVFCLLTGMLLQFVHASLSWSWKTIGGKNKRPLGKGNMSSFYHFVLFQHSPPPVLVYGDEDTKNDGEYTGFVVFLLLLLLPSNVLNTFALPQKNYSREGWHNKCTFWKKQSQKIIETIDENEALLVNFFPCLIHTTR